MTEEDYTKQLLDELEAKFIECDPSTVAGVFFETVGGSSFGTVPPPKGYLDGCKAICEKYNVPLIEDAAESLGTIYKDKWTGTYGDYGIFSFNVNCNFFFGFPLSI